MGKIIRIRLSESDYEKVAGIARATGKGISTLAKEILLNGVKQELKDTQLLNRLIQKIESLQEPPQQTQPIQLIQSERLEELRTLILILYVLLRNFASRMIPIESQKRELLELINKIERELLGATVYEHYRLK